MKTIEINGIRFDAMNITLKSGDYVSLYDEKDLKAEEIECVEGYMCEDCCKKHSVHTDTLDLAMDGMICFVDGCTNSCDEETGVNVYEFNTGVTEESKIIIE